MALVSVPSFGDSFFILGMEGYFCEEPEFPSPHSGILFLWEEEGFKDVLYSGFRPLIRGFFFYRKRGRERT